VARRAPGGLLLAAVGAAVVAVGTFQPWYAVSVTPAGVAAAQRQLASVAQQYGSSSLQAIANELGSRFESLAGRPVATLSAHQTLKNVSAVLLVLAGAALLASLWRLAGFIDGGGGLIAVLGVAAVLCVLYRMFVPPNPAAGYISLSLSWGSWLTLIGAMAVAVGGVCTPRADMPRLHWFRS
jgi:hypothetical protein